MRTNDSGRMKDESETPAPHCPPSAPRASRPIFLFGLALLMGAASGGLGQAAPVGTVARPPVSAPTGSLAEAMTQTAPPDRQVAIAVGAEFVTPAGGTAPPPAGLSVYLVADRFGMLARRFGGVIAIAPPTMTVLNTAPGAPNPFDGMPPADAFKLLAASLTPDQWRTLTSAQGLGMGDLHGDDQRALFKELFAEGIAAYAPGDAAHPPRPQAIPAADLDQGRLRLSRHVRMELSRDDNRGSMALQDSDQPHPGYIAIGGGGLPGPINVMYGVRIRKETHNDPKTGNLDFHAAVLQAPVSLAGIHTVGELIEKIDRATGVEIYADRRYERRGITILAGARAARAVDLLQAIAFCLTGTYRLVGPAFVLTDDLVGLGTRREILTQFERSAERARARALEQTQDPIVEAHPVSSLPPQPGAVSLTDTQMQQALKEQGPVLAGTGPGIKLDMNQLTPDQQDAARRIADGLDRERDALSKLPAYQGHEETLPGPNLLGPIDLLVRPTVDLLLPSYDGPINMDILLSPSELFEPSAKLQIERQQRQNSTTSSTPPAPVRPPQSLANALRPFARRAVIVDASTAADINSIVGSMRKLGLNELWLEVFAPGAPEKSVGSKLDGSDLLTDALKATRATGIHVLPVMRLFEWGRSAPRPIRDLTILGEESPAAQERLRLAESGSMAAASNPPETVDVSPFYPTVQSELEKAVSKVAMQPGIAGLIWRRTTTPGYEAAAESIVFGRSEELGYAVAGRLAFLRSKHADPVDIDPLPGGDSETPLPAFDNLAIENALRTEWRKFRVDEDLNLLRHLRQIAAKRMNAVGVGGALGRQVLVEADRPDEVFPRNVNWYGSWEGGMAPLPSVPSDGFRSGEMAAQAHAQSRTAIFCLAPPESYKPEDVADTLKARAAGSSWEGVVLDLTRLHTGPGRAPTCAERLAALAK